MLNLLQYLFFKRKGAKFFTSSIRPLVSGRKALKVLPPSLSCWGNEASHNAYHTQFVMLLSISFMPSLRDFYKLYHFKLPIFHA